jgi:hypothetical protein
MLKIQTALNFTRTGRAIMLAGVALALTLTLRCQGVGASPCWARSQTQSPRQAAARFIQGARWSCRAASKRRRASATATGYAACFAQQRS